MLKNFFIDSHERSCTPKIIKTAARTSAMASGGALSDRISFKCSFLICPTACFALSRMGWISDNSASISALRACVLASLSATVRFTSATSLRRSDAPANA